MAGRMVARGLRGLRGGMAATGHGLRQDLSPYPVHALTGHARNYSDAAPL